MRITIKVGNMCSKSATKWIIEIYLKRVCVYLVLK